MIAHVVLFKPKPDLSTEDADRLVRAFERALADIAVVRRVHVGRRVLIGRGYEEMMRSDFPYAAILEFDSVDGLRTYLEHPAHTGIGAEIFAAAGDILVYDFEMSSGQSGLSAIAARP